VGRGLGEALLALGLELLKAAVDHEEAAYASCNVRA